ncbi:hypothetical protein, conserved [Entamoeba dispar SAW760]|uniref:Leucine rich repeat containing protein BspA family protein n=1 Tax=Entamoeba dispar (strain ATCC PRA-260 / SAW760) TaxID=370354 RepID=B0EIQ5_ENTDS|nr:uncharacterized protein EDI_172630 [Entamoeba dispar SAW760]EDR25606.1 hypothetical protein, conserved [Entamoeba dispar SAW760]|eukprot:EDR25606.1 hypothetical protein, conserved [Entamoeba dispar SAW760]
MNCKSLTTINIPTIIKEIGSYCFLNCKRLKSVTIPTTVSKIVDSYFKYCSSLTSLNIESTKFITTKNFIFFMNLLNKRYNRFIIRISIIELGVCCFSCCKSLSSVTIPTSITKICK